MDERPFGHESSGIAVRRVVVIGAMLALTVLGLTTIIDIALGRWVIPQHAQAVAHRGTMPPPPRLQVHPDSDLAALRSQKAALLSTWAWSAPDHAFARIPIERALTLYAEHYGPAPKGAPAGESTPRRKVPSCARVSGLRAPADLLARVGFDQRLGARIPLDLLFRDTQGATLPLGSLVNHRPTLLVPGYYRCTNLCDAVRAGVAHAVQGSGLVAGEQFNVILVSIDARESPVEAQTAQHSDQASHPGAHVARWHYLTGATAAREALLQAIGFRFWFDPRNGQYDHAAGIVLLSPQGIITQYLFGVQFEARTLHLGLVNASAGQLGSLVDRLVLLCCDYDPSTGRYSLLISRVLQALGIATALTLGALVLVLRRRERQQRSPL